MHAQTYTYHVWVHYCCLISKSTAIFTPFFTIFQYQNWLKSVTWLNCYTPTHGRKERQPFIIYMLRTPQANFAHLKVSHKGAYSWSPLSILCNPLALFDQKFLLEICNYHLSYYFYHCITFTNPVITQYFEATTWKVTLFCWISHCI
jgi:hypothetical protein